MPKVTGGWILDDSKQGAYSFDDDADLELQVGYEVMRELHLSGRHNQKLHGQEKKYKDLKNKLNNAVDEIMEFGKYIDKERMIILDDNGNAILDKVGEADEIRFDERIALNSYAIIHNHPDSDTFSKADLLEFSKSNSVVLVATCRNGDTHTLISDDNSYDRLTGNKAGELSNVIYDISVSKGYDLYTQMIERGIGEDEASRSALIYSIQKFSELAGVEYIYKKEK